VRQRARRVAPEGYRLERRRLLDRDELAQVVALNRDIFIRTMCLTGSFAWIAVLGSMQGDVVLAANGVLLQILYVSAAGLDGFAMAAEALVGQALGARDRAALRRAVVVTTVTALALAALMALAAALAGGAIIAALTDVEAVRAVAREHVLWASLVPLAGVMAYQLDGIFIGAAEGRGMRNAMLLSAALFIPLGWLLTDLLGNHGLWLALWIWMFARAATLAIRYPALEGRAGPSGPAGQVRH
jgi:MATE family multidrug resistance protein